jgi:hypothetical protein
MEIKLKADLYRRDIVLNNKVLLVFLCITVLSVTFFGCTSKSNFDNLKKDYDTVKNDYDALQANLTTAQREYNLLQSNMTSLQKEYDTTKATLEAKVASQSAVITEAQNTNVTLQSKLDTTLNTEIKFTYRFKYQMWQFNWDISIPLREYLYYKAKSRISDSSKYTSMVTDSHADSLINILVQNIKDAVLTYDLKKTDTVDLVGAFVQSLIYASQDTASPYDNRPLYPIETLFEQGGDCEDTSILAATLLQKLEYNQVFFVFSQPKHVALGIDNPASPYVNGWEYQAKRYIYLETTGDNYIVGAAPSVYTTLQPEILPIVK